MAPKISNAEINRIKKVVSELEQNKTYSFSDTIKGSLPKSDQTIERFRNLIIPSFKKKGINFKLTGDDFTFTERKKEEKKVTQEKSNLTKMPHEYVAPPNYSDYLTSILMGDTPLFVGPPGCGKSLTAEVIAHELGKEVFKRDDYQVLRLSLGGYFNPADLIGEMLLFDSKKGDGVVTEYVYGHLTEAVEKGYTLICDEVDCMGPEANSVFQRITEMDGRMVIKTERGSVEIEKHPHFRLIFTANTYLTGDAGGLFSGAQVQNSAFRDRINATFEFDYMPEYEAEILRNTYKLPSKVCDILYGIPNDPTSGLVNILRSSCKDGTIKSNLSMRTIIDFAKHYRAFAGRNKNLCRSWHKAMQICFISAFPPQYHQQIKETINKVCCPELVPTMNTKDIDKHADYLKKNGFFPMEDTYLPEELVGRNVH